MTPGDEERLAALIDNELSAEEKAALLERLAHDEALRGRLAAMRRDRDRLAGALDALLAAAPVERLRAFIPAEVEAPRPAPRRRPVGWLELAAGLVIGLVIAGAAAWIATGSGERDDWRQAIVQYMELYTPDTFALADPDRTAAAGQLRAVGDRVGVALDPDKVSVSGLRYRTAFNLSYDGAPLGEIAYTDKSGAPVLFCVIADGKPDAAARAVARDGLSFVTWTRGGKSYMLLARMPKDEVAELAQPLTARF